MFRPKERGDDREKEEVVRRGGEEREKRAADESGLWAVGVVDLTWCGVFSVCVSSPPFFYLKCGVVFFVVEFLRQQRVWLMVAVGWVILGSYLAQRFRSLMATSKLSLHRILSLFLFPPPSSLPPRLLSCRSCWMRAESWRSVYIFFL